MKKFTRIAMVVYLLLCAFFIPAAHANIAPVDLAEQSIVRIYVEHYSNNTGIAYATGSGFVIGNSGDEAQTIVTNRHVIESGITDEDGSFIPTTVAIYVVYDNINNCIPAELVAVNEVQDMAVLRTEKAVPDRSPIRIRSFDPEKVIGDVVYSIGFPAASDAIMRQSEQNMLYSGKEYMTWSDGKIVRILNQAHTYSEAGETIQTTTVINHGNSGGPLVDELGKVIGICSFGSEQGTNIYYAISSNELIKFLDQNNISYAKESGSGTRLGAIFAFVGSAAVIMTVVLLSKLRKQTPPVSDPVSSPQSASKSEPAFTPGKPKPIRELLCIEGPLAQKCFRLDGMTTIGRDPRRCQIILPPDCKGVSAMHCTVTFDGIRVLVTDQNSSCGTFVDGNRLTPQTPVVMHRGQRLTLGSNNNVFLLGGSSGKA